jgi:O-methyltransferase
MLRKIYSYLFLGILKVIHNDRSRIIGKVVQERLSYLLASDLYDLWQRVDAVEKTNLEGIMIEAGCALGGSAIVISASKHVSRHLFIYDTFGLIPPPSEYDGPDAHQRYKEISEGKSKGIDGDPYYGYQKDLIDHVKCNFERLGYDLKKNNIHLIKGEFAQTLIPSESVVFAHIDADWYESVKICLERIVPRLVSQGVIVVDDYSIWSGCRKAVDEFFNDKKESFVFEQKAALHIIKR